MKKNIAMRLASGIMLASLLSTCVISGTFAKYTTEATSNDEARVAKFGVNITANGSTFADEYATDDTGVSGTIAKSVVTAGGAGDAIVAPGTTGEMVAMTLNGTPEVAVKVSYAADLELANWVVDGDYYCPITITVNGTPFNGMDYDTMDEFEEAVEGAINAYSKNYAANQDLSVESTVSTPDVSWEWAFEGNDDAKDTKLGDVAVTGNAATIELTIVTTVEQID